MIRRLEARTTSPQEPGGFARADALVFPMAFDDPYDRLSEQSADYQRMEAALDWLAERWRDRPSLDDAAEAAGLSPSHFQRVFTRWAGVSP